MARGLHVFVNIGAKVSSSVGSATSSTVRQFGAMNRRLRVMAAETSAHMASADRRWGSIRRNGQDFAMGVSAPMSMMAGLGAKTAYEWAQVGNNLQAVTQMTEEQRKAVERAARSQIGNPVDNLRAGLDLGRTGLTPSEIATGLPIAVKLARSDPESVDQAQAADIVTNVIKGMKMPIEELGRAADVIGYAAAQSSSDVRLMGESFKYAGPIAARAGITIEESAAAFMTMADAGIKGSEAGVAFRSMLVRLIKPTKGAMGVLAKYNMDLADYVTLSGKVTGAGIVDQLKAGGINASGATPAIDALLNNSSLSGADLVERITNAVAQGLDGGASAMDKDLIATAVTSAVMSGADKIDFRKFISDAMAKGWTTGDLVNFFDTRQGARIATMFGPDMEKTLDKMRGAAGSKGFLDKMFAMQNQGVVGSMQRLAQSVGNLVIAISETGIIDTFANAVDKLSKGINDLGKANPALLKFGTYAALFLAVLGPLGFLVSGVAAGFRALGWGLQMLWKMGGSVLTRLAPLIGRVRGSLMLLRMLFTVGGWSAVGAAVAPFALLAVAIGAVALAIAWVVSKWDGFKAFFAGFAQGFSEALSPETKAAMERFGSAIKGLFDAILAPIKAVGDALGVVFNWFKSLFGPAETEKWSSAGQAFGSVIGGMANYLTTFIDKLTAAVNLVRTLFRVGAGQMSGGIGGAASAGARAGSLIAQEAARTTRARGGGVTRGSSYTINENGEEGIVLGRSGTIIPHAATAALIAAMTTGVPIQATAGQGAQTNHIYVSGAGDPNAVADAVIKKLEQRAGASARAGLHD